MNDDTNDDVKRDAAFEVFWQNTELPAIMQNVPSFVIRTHLQDIKNGSKTDWDESWRQCKIANGIQ